MRLNWRQVPGAQVYRLKEFTFFMRKMGDYFTVDIEVTTSDMYGEGVTLDGVKARTEEQAELLALENLENYLKSRLQEVELLNKRIVNVLNRELKASLDRIKARSQEEKGSQNEKH